MSKKYFKYFDGSINVISIEYDATTIDLATTITLKSYYHSQLKDNRKFTIIGQKNTLTPLPNNDPNLKHFTNLLSNLYIKSEGNTNINVNNIVPKLQSIGYTNISLNKNLTSCNQLPEIQLLINFYKYYYASYHNSKTNYDFCYDFFKRLELFVSHYYEEIHLPEFDNLKQGILDRG